MSRRANCWDNAVAESFFATLKKELLEELRGKNREQSSQLLVNYIEAYYNRKRLHSSLGYQTPIRHEENWKAKRLSASKPERPDDTLWELVDG